MSVRLTDLRTIADRVKEAAKRADNDQNGTLSAGEMESAEYNLPDGFAIAQALKSVSDWARQGTDDEVATDKVVAKADDAFEAMKARDADGNGVIEGRELSAAHRLKTFDAFAGALPSVVGALGDYKTFYDLIDGCKTLDRVRFHAASEVPAALAQAIIDAGRVSTYDIQQLSDVFANVDQNEVIVRTLQDPDTHQLFLAVDYGAGDNTYGAVFDGTTHAQLAGVNDGDLMQPAAPRPD